MNDSKSAYQRAKTDVSILRWVFGWHPVVGWVMVVFLLSGTGYYFGLMGPMALLGLILGGPIWYQGTRYINRHADGIREGFMEDVNHYGPIVLEAAGMAEDGQVFVLTEIPERTPPLVNAHGTVDVTLVGVDETGLWINDSVKLDLVFLNAKLETAPEFVLQYPYSNLESATYENGELVVRPKRETEDIETFRTALNERPADLLAEIEARLG